jgi:hypothetical protein
LRSSTPPSATAARSTPASAPSCGRVRRARRWNAQVRGPRPHHLQETVATTWAPCCRGGIQSAPRVRRPWLRRPRGHSARIAAGRRWPGAQRREQRGSLRRDALLGRGRRSFGPQAAGPAKARTAAHPRGKRKPEAAAVQLRTHWSGVRRRRGILRRPACGMAPQNDTRA